jgi:predicted membrane chloride channel (bestrophin family)
MQATPESQGMAREIPTKLSRIVDDALPEKQLAKALVTALVTFEHELRLDLEAEVIDEDEAHRIDQVERERTSEILGELHELERRYPPPSNL